MRRSARYASRDNVLAAGMYFAERGEDAREVLKQFYDRVKEADPDHVPTYVAIAKLALSKGDFKVCADTVSEAIELDATHPDLFYLRARAFAPSDSEQASNALNMALTLNPLHIDALLYQAEKAIDAEQYDEAERAIKLVFSVNVHEPRAWALNAVIAHIRGQYEIEGLMRTAALSTWSDNPEVDHLIGRKLSDKYRFSEGAEYQRRALAFDPKHHAAKFQLAQDLLRLGFDDVGWELAKEVNKDDPYNVVAFNLVQLYDHIEGFKTLTAGDIHVRMDALEADIYGEEVLELLTEAKEVLCAKYDVQPDGPIIVEIFPDQKDFAIRTFGVPGGAGFLGVCFGRVVTANSPASQRDSPTNWQSVLWHEFCHVVTLAKTRNRMPRWLSEGISVHEELQRDDAWSQKMSTTYKAMVLRDEMSPISELSGAFLSPPTPVHLQFAYYQAGLAVEYLLAEHGIDALTAVLDELAAGVSVNDALIMHMGSIQKLDDGFLRFVKQRAAEFGSAFEFDPAGPPRNGPPPLREAWFDEHPNDLRSILRRSQRLLQENDHEGAVRILERLREAGVVNGEPGGVLEDLAASYRKLENVSREKEILRLQTGLASNALKSHQRLAEFAVDDSDWEGVAEQAEGILAINPLLRIGHEMAAKAAEERGLNADAIAPLQALLGLDP
ncbi:MAG: hypothetical protein AAF989_16830, partial [Planctomycetota bacterium]